MAVQPNDPDRKALDPRLRRLVAATGDPVQLRDDLQHGYVRSTRQLAPDEPVAAADLAVDVLVQLRAQASPPELAGVQWVKIVNDIYSAEVPVTALAALAAAPEVSYVEAGRPAYPELDTSLPQTRADRLQPPPPTGAGLTGAGVVVGIIDYGLDFTLDDFRNPDGTTRVAFLWDQRLTAQDGEHPPAGYPGGVEYDAVAINRALDAAEPFKAVRHKPEPASHGTHVAGIAAGNGRSADDQFAAGRFVGAAPEATIIFVQPEGGGLVQAFSYIFAKAEELGQPCVVNVSLGGNGGSHDGESVLERAIDQLLGDQPGRAVVKSAGNEHEWQGHASGRLTAGARRALRWGVQGGSPGSSPGDRTPNALELWYSSRDRLNVTLVSPSGEETPVVAPDDEPLPHRFAGGNLATIDSDLFTPYNGDARVYLAVGPGDAEAVEPGIWQVVLDAVTVAEGRFDAWIGSDRSSPGQQSVFVGDDVDSTMTLSIPGTFRRGMVVANYDHRQSSLAPSSSRGRTRDGRHKPDLAAPGTDIWSAHALGGRPGPDGELYPVRIAKSGTSMSAPHVAGIVALLLQRKPDLTATQIRQILVASAGAHPASPAFDIGWGFGTVDAKKALTLIG